MNKGVSILSIKDTTVSIPASDTRLLKLRKRPDDKIYTYRDFDVGGRLISKAIASEASGASLLSTMLNTVFVAVEREKYIKRLLGEEKADLASGRIVVYAKRLNRDTYTRFTKNRQPQPCSIVTVALTPLDEDTYELSSAWIGPVGYSFPDHPDAVPESRAYWARHALVWGTQSVQPGTETKVCPW